jgi:glutamate---cysteine ligase / carboxylate-amine ligase
MRIAVCVKQVPDATVNKRINPATKRLERSGEAALNPFDVHAVEEALRIKEGSGEGEVVAVSLGPANAMESLRKALAMGVDRAVLLSRARVYLPHLLALSCSSPFYEGLDTGFASFRVVLCRRWPYAGIPPRFDSEAHYQSVVDDLLAGGAIEDARNIYWGLRIHPVYPTLEFRVTDVCPRVEDALAIAALVRAIVMAAAFDRLPPDPTAGRPAGIADALLSGNEWMAARHGLEGKLLDPADDWRPVPARAAVRRLIDCIAPAAESAGDAAALAGIETLLERGTGADRMRRVYRERGGFRPLIEWLVAETILGTGLDRRRGQREHCA